MPSFPAPDSESRKREVTQLFGANGVDLGGLPSDPPLDTICSRPFLTLSSIVSSDNDELEAVGATVVEFGVMRDDEVLRFLDGGGLEG